MRMLLSLLGTCACLANAIQITAPVFNSTQSAGDSVTVQWTSVDTDPAIFSIELVNFVNFPPSYVILAYGVQTSSLSYTVQIPCDTAPAYGYQINAINGTNVFVIYAQSQNFTITEAANPAQCVSPSTIPSCGPQQTATVTAGGCPQLYAPPTNTYPPNYNNLPSSSITPPAGFSANTYNTVPSSSTPVGPPANTYNTGPTSSIPSGPPANMYNNLPGYTPSSYCTPVSSYPKKHKHHHQSAASGYQPAAPGTETTPTTTPNVQPTYNPLPTSSAPPYGYHPYKGA